MPSLDAHSPSSPTWLAEELARTIGRLTLEDLSDDMVRKTKLHLLDFVGCMLGASTIDQTAPIRAYGEAWGPAGPCAVVGSKASYDAEYASLVNATVGHGFEMDDYAPRASTHPGCQVVPAALATAQELGSSGSSLLLAIAVGFEMSIRLGLATMPSMLVERGFHESCVHGVISSATAAGMLHALPFEDLVMAYSIAASHASGTAEYARTGGEVKRLHAGLGGMGGIRSVRLARCGLTGPPSIFEGTRGYFQAFTNHAQPELLMQAWGRRWEMLTYGALKPYYCVGSIHGQIDAVLNLQREHGFTGEDIEHIELGVDRLARIHAGAVGPEPRNMVAAQFSIEYSTAMSLTWGTGVDDYMHVAARDFRVPEIDSLARRISMVDDAECDAAVPAASLGKATITLRNGRTLTAKAYGTGTPSNPMPLEAVEAKFLDLATRAISRSDATELMQRILEIETLDDVRPMVGLLAA